MFRKGLLGKYLHTSTLEERMHQFLDENLKKFDEAQFIISYLETERSRLNSLDASYYTESSTYVSNNRKERESFAL